MRMHVKSVWVVAHGHAHAPDAPVVALSRGVQRSLTSLLMPVSCRGPSSSKRATLTRERSRTHESSHMCLQPHD